MAVRWVVVLGGVAGSMLDDEGLQREGRLQPRPQLLAAHCAAARAALDDAQLLQRHGARLRPTLGRAHTPPPPPHALGVQQYQGAAARRPQHQHTQHTHQRPA